MSYNNELKIYHLDISNWDNQWSELKKEFPNITDWGINTIFNNLKNSVKSLVIEKKYTCKDFRNMYSNYISKKYKEVSKFTHRIHFFSKEQLTLQELLFDSKNVQEYYIGYSVVRPLSERCVGRTVLDPQKINGSNGGFILSARFKVNINGTLYHINGFPYISQSTDVTVCAHTALWSVCRYLSEKYHNYPEIYPFDIVNLTDSHNGRTYPYRGMTYSDYSKILSEIGTSPIIIRLKEKQSDKTLEPDKFEELYSYMESVFPILASLPNHVNVIIGHTIDYKKNGSPTFGANFISSSEYIDNFIVMDDNLFPYQKLARKNNRQLPSGNFLIGSVTTAVCPLPEKAFLSADKAIKWYKKFLNDNTTLDILSDFGKGKWVTRIFLTNSSSFKKKKIEENLKNEKLDQIDYEISKMFLPHFIWVCELSTIEQYKNKKCTAEIILDSTSSVKEDPLIYSRFGNVLFFNKEDCTFVTNTEFSQFIHNLGE